MTELTMNALAQSRGPGQLHDSKFMPAAEKKQVLKHWEMFLKSGLEKEHFTKPLYHHLIQNCSFIAHYDIHGFYAEYFNNGDDAMRFLSQFDRAKGCRSIELGGSWWFRDGNDVSQDYYDINNAMVDIAAQFMPELAAKFSGEQKDDDLAVARLLMQKHGIKPEF